MSLAWLKGKVWLGSFGKLVAMSMLAATLGTTGCGDDPVKAGIAKGCTLNSDCDDGLVCSFALCHKECAATGDCPAGQRCVQTEKANLCQLDEEEKCALNSDCREPLVCARDLQCRNECNAKADCLKGQECAEHACAEPMEVDEMGGLIGAVDMGGGGEGGGPSGPTAGTGGTGMTPGAGGEGGAEPVTCTPGGACSPAGMPCQLGVIACDGGAEVCEVAGDAEDGTECGTDEVCSSGACVACVVGEDCQPDANNVCEAGTVTCALGPDCESAGNVANGTDCGTDQVCSAGSCVACVANEACDPPGQPCKNGTRSCGNGPVCNAAGNKGAGEDCGTGQVCDSGGICADCVQDGPCVPDGNDCHQGIWDCATGPNCVETQLTVPDGTVCDGGATYNFCSSGTCAACVNGNPCIPTNPCHKGTLNCATTPPTCTDNSQNATDGIACGDNQSCISGACLTNDRVLTVTSAPPAAVPIDAPFSTVTIKLVDGNAANVQGAQVTVLASPGAYAVASGATNASGIAQISGRVGRAIDTYTYTVSAPGATSIQFTVDAIAPTAKHIFTLANVTHLNGAATVPGAGTISKLDQANAMVSAKDGTLYIAAQCAVFKLTPAGLLTRFAGTATEQCTFNGESGLGTSVGLYNVFGLALDEDNGYLYIADYSNYRVRQVDLASGNLLTYAGDPAATNANPWGDGGPADSAYLLPTGLAVASNGDLYISDYNSSRLRKVDFVTGIISTVFASTPCSASNPLSFYDCGYYGDGCSLAWDKTGKMFISAQLCGGGLGSFNGVARVEGNSLVLIAGNTGAATPAEGGVATSAAFTDAPAIAFDKAGNLFLATRGDHRVRRIDAVNQHITTVAGNGTAGYAGEYVLGSDPAVQVNNPSTLSFDDAGNLYFADYTNSAVRGLWNIGATTAPTGTLASTLGTGQTVKVDAPFSALAVKLTDTGNISGVDVRWKRFGTETGSGLGATGAISTTSKTNASGTSAMTGRVGLAIGDYKFEASYADIHGVPVTGSPQTFTVAAEAPAAGIIFPIFNYVHTSSTAFTPGPATFGKLYNSANGVTAASDGTIYASDYAAVYEITPRGEISVFAGTPGGYGFAGDSGPAVGAKLANVHGLALDEDAGVLYIADSGNQRIRMVSLTTGVIDTLAGGSADNTAPYGDGGLGPDANIGTVYSVTVGPDGRVYFPDTAHYRIRVIEPDTTVISTWLNGTYNTPPCVAGTVSLYYTDFGSAIRFDDAGGAYISGYICQGTTTANVLGIMHRASNGATTRIIGVSGAANTPENGDAITTTLPDLSDFIVDSNGDLILALWTDDRIRKINMTTGKVNTIAGDGTNGYFQPGDVSPDPGAYVAATGARLYNPNKLAEWPGGHLLIADRDNYVVRMIW